MTMKKIKLIFVFIALFTGLTLIKDNFISVSSLNRKRLTKNIFNYDSSPVFEVNQGDLIDFEGFDNENGTDREIIPNIVHLLYLQQPFIKFYELINIFSIHQNHDPDFIYIHCDNCSFSGKYFEELKAHKDLWRKIKFFQIPFKDTIFGVKYGWINHHRSDIWRLMILMNYGGIYLDSDVYVVKSLREFLKYEMAVSWDEPQDIHGLGVQVLIAHKNARLLKAHFDSYRYNYTPTNWYYNAGFVPTTILRKHRYLAHPVKVIFGTQTILGEKILFSINSDEWKNYSAIHLFINWRTAVRDNDYENFKVFNETNIWIYNKTYGQMCRAVLLKENLWVPKDWKDKF